MTVGIGLQILILLDLGQHLAAVHSRQVEVQQDEIRAGRVDVAPSRFRNAMASTPSEATCRSDGRVGVAEGFLRQPDIAGTVFDQENLNGD